MGEKSDNEFTDRNNYFKSLSKSDVQNILDFSEFLLFKGHKKEFVRSTELDPKEDPILKIIGIADVEPFANKIDQELYGV
jgi:hypothetical protein